MELRDNKGNSVVCIKIIYNNTCPVCKIHFIEDDSVIGISNPYHILLHTHCAPYYNYNNIYIHQQPISFYDTRTARRGRLQS